MSGAILPLPPRQSCRKGTNLTLESQKEVEGIIKFFLRDNEFLNIWIETTKANVRPGSLYLVTLNRQFLLPDISFVSSFEIFVFQIWRT